MQVAVTPRLTALPLSLPLLPQVLTTGVLLQKVQPHPTHCLRMSTASNEEAAANETKNPFQSTAEPADAAEAEEIGNIMRNAGFLVQVGVICRMNEAYNVGGRGHEVTDCLALCSPFWSSSGAGHTYPSMQDCAFCKVSDPMTTMGNYAEWMNDVHSASTDRICYRLLKLFVSTATLALCCARFWTGMMADMRRYAKSLVCCVSHSTPVD